MRQFCGFRLSCLSDDGIEPRALPLYTDALAGAVADHVVEQRVGCDLEVAATRA